MNNDCIRFRHIKLRVHNIIRKKKPHRSPLEAAIAPIHYSKNI